MSSYPLDRRVAWKLPDRVVYHAAIRLTAYATVGRYSTTVVPELSAMDAVGRWEKDLLS